MPSAQTPSDLEAFCTRVLSKGAALYRDLPWRRTHDPYAVWISEVMLQQTQVTRVDGRWQRWLERFPTVGDLARAEPADVLDEWQGMGYNRRALALLRAARLIDAADEFPQDAAELQRLPGIGPATAAGIRAFAFNLPGVYVETNVRTVFLHELFAGRDGVSDAELRPLVEATCPPDDPRTWYFALLDYGAYLKRTVPNPSRRSRTHVRQSSFEGSHRQKRAEVVRILLAARGTGRTTDEVLRTLCKTEQAAGRPPVGEGDVVALLGELASEGFCRMEDGRWLV